MFKPEKGIGSGDTTRIIIKELSLCAYFFFFFFFLQTCVQYCVPDVVVEINKH